jgi:hypothetical protein
MNRFKTAIAACTGILASSLWMAIPAAVSGSPPAESQTQYRPIQSISLAFGSKSAIGYFVREAGTCQVTLMISEKGDPEQPQPLSAARLRLALHPGQTAGLDSEEGRSLHFTCGGNAATLLVDAGERDLLMADQDTQAIAISEDEAGAQ